VTAPPDVEQPPAVETAWDERPIVGNARGLPWWAAVLLAFLVAAVAAWIDIHGKGSLGRLYQGAYVLGCLIAVCAVRRRNLFGPMVQPPLVFAVTAIGAVVLSQPGPLFGTGVKQLVFSVALPLTSNFPTMAITTGVTVAIGLARLWFQRNPFPQTKSNRRGQAADPLDLLDGRGPRTPEPGARSRDRAPRPDRTRSGRPAAGGRYDQDPGSGGRGRIDQEPGSAGRSRSGRGRSDQDAGDPRPRPGSGTRRSASRDQPPPRSGRTDPPPAARRGRSTPPPDPRRRQPEEPRRDPDRARRRRPPEDYR
jgi:hypothetical protein